MESKVITIEPSKPPRTVIRVAAYCRVSSDSSDQLHSFAAQVQYYTKTIGSNDKMELVDIYADEGITGTKAEIRDDFNRLIADCRKGKIDRVFTKSVSRFARNTVDSLMYARILKECGVSILFEKENIDTAFMSSELLLAISGAQAQEESISISQNMRWSVEQCMKNGTYLSSSTPYGYEIKEGEYHIVESEAKVVQLIFKSYLSGMSKKAIADMLNETCAPKRPNIATWRYQTVGYILNNERYIGDALFQKGYTTDTLPFTRKQNHGEKTQYYVEGMNPPIVSKEDFQAVQELMKTKKRNERSKNLERPLSKKIVCSCGNTYRPIVVNGKTYWGCRLYNMDSSRCRSRRIPEKEIYDAFITMVNKLQNNKTLILKTTISRMERLQRKICSAITQIKEIDKEIAKLNGRNLVLTRLNAKGILRPAEYREQSGNINARVGTLRTERRRLLREQDEGSVLSRLCQLDSLLAELEYPITEFDEELFENIIEKVTVPSETSLCFHLIGGLSLSELIGGCV